MRKWLLTAGIFVSLDLNAFADERPFRNLVLTYTCYITNIPTVVRGLDVWIPVPVSDDRQTVTLLSVSGKKGTFNNDIKYGNRIYYIHYNPQSDQLEDTVKIVFSYGVTVHEKTVVEAKRLAPLPKESPPDNYKIYLAENRLIPFAGPIMDLKDEMNLPDKPIVAGRRIYDNLISRMVYNYKAPGAGLGDAVWACSSKTGDCSDYHSVFIGICRVSGIPADHEFGIPVRKTQGSRMIKDWHCWAKFWVAGPGWITADISEADKHPELQEHFFGTLSNEYVTLSHGRDVVLNPRQKGEALNIFADPYAEADGALFKSVKWLAKFREVKE